MTPLTGCPRCNYRYEREPGYFLPAIFFSHFGLASAVGLAGGLLEEHFLHAGLKVELLWAIIPALIVAMIAIRWSKSTFIAMDRFLDRS